MRFQTIPGRAADAIQTVTPKNGMVRQDNLYEYMKLLAIFFFLKNQDELFTKFNRYCATAVEKKTEKSCISFWLQFEIFMILLKCIFMFIGLYLQLMEKSEKK